MTHTSTDAAEHGTLTSLTQLFGHTMNGTQVQAIEIPLFQRDYAQGRQTEQVTQVRKRFIADLCAALDGGHTLHLDFVFGDVVNGTLYPLDGQQRLTTLFLLHCYLAWHQAEMPPQPWHAFRYATRPGARKFCEFLTQCHPNMANEDLSAWLCDQAYYLPTWKHDPSIQGMLVVLDALHQHYWGQTPEHLHAAWQRLTSSDQPAIRFLLLPVAAQKLDNTLYVKMNSRGRPLTEFENFKAELEALLHKNPVLDSAVVKTFSHKIDTDWADLFWEYCKEQIKISPNGAIDSKDLVDNKFMRYLRFLLEVRTWQRGHVVQSKEGDLQALLRLSKLLLGCQAAHASEDIAWIMQALEVWLNAEAQGSRRPKAIAALFSELFTREASNATMPLRVFNFGDFGDAPVGVDLFHACCALYGTRPWKLPHTVLFYGVLQGLMMGLTLPELHPRLRLLRNLIEASKYEVRADETRNNMPALLREVDILMEDGPLADIKTFNQVQLRNEQAKRELLAQQPSLLDTLCHLEDHDLLRGGLTVFDLAPTQDTATFRQRAAQFEQLFNGPFETVSAALLVKGHAGRMYYERRDGYRFTYLGAAKSRQTGLWEDHWRARSNEHPHPSNIALMALLDAMAGGQAPQTVVDLFVKNPDTPMDWRYYLVKYPAMRSAKLEFAGNYVVAAGAGYAICIPKTDSCDNRSNHHDAYLLALVQEAGIDIEDIGNEGWPRCFPGHVTEERYLKLRHSGLQIRCLENGWGFTSLPTQADQRQAFEQIADKYHIQNSLYAVPQANGVDTKDRIVLGVALLRDLVGAGL